MMHIADCEESQQKVLAQLILVLLDLPINGWKRCTVFIYGAASARNMDCWNPCYNKDIDVLDSIQKLLFHLALGQIDMLPYVRGIWMDLIGFTNTECFFFFFIKVDIKNNSHLLRESLAVILLKYIDHAENPCIDPISLLVWYQNDTPIRKFGLRKIKDGLRTLLKSEEGSID